MPEHSYEEEDQPQNYNGNDDYCKDIFKTSDIHSMFDEITDLETLLAPELLSMAQKVQVTIHNCIFKTTLQFILIYILFT